MRDAVRVLKAAADESRLRILHMLQRRPLCVCEIAHVLGLAQSTVSRHLKQLEECGLLQRTKDGLWVEYRVPDPASGSLQRALLELLRSELAGKGAMGEDEARARVVDRREICGRPEE